MVPGRWGYSSHKRLFGPSLLYAYVWYRGVLLFLSGPVALRLGALT